ncbi:hypothetical protein TNCV_1617061 [Trichonephila clavipes]|nr:hypothetical protein TNCV_1617061 [Trichonephila clavipes]
MDIFQEDNTTLRMACISLHYLHAIASARKVIDILIIENVSDHQLLAPQNVANLYHSLHRRMQQHQLTFRIALARQLIDGYSSRKRKGHPASFQDTTYPLRNVRIKSIAKKNSVEVRNRNAMRAGVIAQSAEPSEAVPDDSTLMSINKG